MKSLDIEYKIKEDIHISLKIYDDNAIIADNNDTNM